jgi:hypothetical protein
VILRDRVTLPRSRWTAIALPYSTLPTFRNWPRLLLCVFLEFRTGCPVGRKEKLLPSPTRWDTFQHAFALAVDVQERICHAMLAWRAATDVELNRCAVILQI